MEVVWEERGLLDLQATVQRLNSVSVLQNLWPSAGLSLPGLSGLSSSASSGLSSSASLCVTPDNAEYDASLSSYTEDRRRVFVPQNIATFGRELEEAIAKAEK